ncbi:MAG: flagellar hook-associated protein FlgK [Phycisphaerae bacterium]
MSNFYIGLSGLQVAQSALETIGTNITNAATPGYHRQQVEISAMPLDSLKVGVSSGGAMVEQISRQMDMLLEREIIRQEPLLGQANQELQTLQTIEAALGDLDEEGLGKAINNFYNALSELSAQPNSQAHLEQVVWTGEALASMIRNLSSFVTGLKYNIGLESQDVITSANNLLDKIADYNSEIHATSVAGGNTNLLRDKRDEAISELSELLPVSVHIQGMQYGMVNVEAWGVPMVMRTDTTKLEIDITDDDLMGVSVMGAAHYDPSVTGGKVGALLELHNSLIPDIQEQLDTLAGSIIETMNELHVQGVGSEGSFTELTGWRNENLPIDQWSDTVEAGDMYLRVTDTATGAVTRYHVMTVDPAVDDVDSVVAAFNALIDPLAIPPIDSHVHASNNSGALHLYADNGYEFDFLPAVSTEPNPATLNITGTASANFSGIYTGDVEEVYTVNIHGNGDVASSLDLYAQVENSAGEVVATINIGNGYAPGDPVYFDNGLSVAFNAGSFNNGDSFTVDALVESDSSGVLAAMGINSFFSGHDAETITVSQRLIDRPQLLASAIGPEMTDNENLVRMASLAESPIGRLGELGVGDYYRRMITDIGHEVSSRENRKVALDTVRKQLMNHRDAISGVDTNEEAAKMLMYEQMFQAVSKFITTQNRALQDLMEII